MPTDENPTPPDLWVFLLKIRDRPFGFRVVAVCATTDAEALEYVEKTYAAQSRDVTKSDFARIEHRCRAVAGCAATMTYEE